MAKLDPVCVACHVYQQRANAVIKSIGSDCDLRACECVVLCSSNLPSDQHCASGVAIERVGGRFVN